MARQPNGDDTSIHVRETGHCHRKGTPRANQGLSQNTEVHNSLLAGRRSRCCSNGLGGVSRNGHCPQHTLRYPTPLRCYIRCLGRDHSPRPNGGTFPDNRILFHVIRLHHQHRLPLSSTSDPTQSIEHCLSLICCYSEQRDHTASRRNRWSHRDAPRPLRPLMAHKEQANRRHLGGEEKTQKTASERSNPHSNNRKPCQRCNSRVLCNRLQPQ